MPIYEYECPKHGRIELLEKIEDAYKQFIYCPVQGEVITCGIRSERVYSIVSMQPDTLWSGVNTEQGYFTSKKQRLNYLKQNNIERVERGMIEEAHKKNKTRFKDIQQKNENKLEKFLTKELASVTID